MEWVEEELGLEEIGRYKNVATLTEAQPHRIVEVLFGFKAKCLVFNLNKEYNF